MSKFNKPVTQLQCVHQRLQNSSADVTRGPLHRVIMKSITWEYRCVIPKCSFMAPYSEPCCLDPCGICGIIPCVCLLCLCISCSTDGNNEMWLRYIFYQPDLTPVMYSTLIKAVLACDTYSKLCMCHLQLGCQLFVCRHIYYRRQLATIKKLFSQTPDLYEFWIICTYMYMLDFWVSALIISGLCCVLS